MGDGSRLEYFSPFALFSIVIFLLNIRIKSLPFEGSRKFFRVAPKIIVFNDFNSSSAFLFFALSIAKRLTNSSGVCPPSSDNHAFISELANATLEESLE